MACRGEEGRVTIRPQRVRAVALEVKLAYWISSRTNVLFRCGTGVRIGPEVSAAFGNAGLQWRAPHVVNGEFEQILSDDTIKAIWIDGLDRVSKKLWRAVLDLAGAKMIWGTVTVLDEDDFDLESGAVKVEGFDVVVDMPMKPTSPRLSSGLDRRLT
jgi:hypothetical protein